MKMYSCARLLPIFFVSLISANGHACGTVGWALDGILEGPDGNSPMADMGAATLMQSLVNAGGPCGVLANNEPLANQAKILTLLRADNQPMRSNNYQKLLARYGRQLFISFDCLPHQKGQPGYAQVMAEFGGPECQSLQQRLYVTSGNGANLRDAAKVANNKLTVLPQGAIVKALARHGDWYQVEVIRFNPYFMPECKYKTPCMQGYVHKGAFE